MAVKDVIRMGHPTLAKVAEPVGDFTAPSLKALIQDLFDTMASLDGAGLASRVKTKGFNREYNMLYRRFIERMIEGGDNGPGRRYDQYLAEDLTEKQ